MPNVILRYILPQASTSCCSRSAIFGGVCIWHVTMFQTCSIGERSGDLSGHGGVLTRGPSPNTIQCQSASNHDHWLRQHSRRFTDVVCKKPHPKGGCEHNVASSKRSEMVEGTMGVWKRL
ncbi:hypothetical protein TNCV_3288401 [Trichonephila clavipes]|nr:hypothetical protein TNCV_3288401 [Trichonephila clavipes]